MDMSSSLRAVSERLELKLDRLKTFLPILQMWICT